MIRTDGVAVTVKSGRGITTRVTAVEWTRLPLVPVMVKEKVPAGVELAVVIANVDVPLPATDPGLKL